MKIHNPGMSPVPTKTWSVMDYEVAFDLGLGDKHLATPATVIPGPSPFFFDGYLPERQKYFSHFYPKSYHVPEIRLDVIPNAMTTGSGSIFTDTGYAMWPSPDPGASKNAILAGWSDLHLAPTENPDEYTCPRLNAFLPLEGAYQLNYTALGNYHHMLLDIIPRLWALQQEDTRNFIRSHGSDPDRIPIIINHYAPYLFDHIAELGLDINRERILSVPYNGCIRADKLFVPHVLNSFAGWASENLVDFYRNHSQRFKIEDESASLPKKIFHLRRDVKNDRRAIRDVDAIADLLIKYGFTELSPDPSKPRVGWATFANATHIVGAMGSNLSNSVFSPPGTRILSIQSDASLFSLVAAVGAAAKHETGYLFGRSFPETGHGEQVQFEIDFSALKRAMEAMLDG